MIDLIIPTVLSVFLILLHRDTNTPCVKDFISGWFMSAILYLLCKFPFLGIIGGWTWPMSKNLSHHHSSGGIACMMVLLFYLCCWYRKRRLRQLRIRFIDQAQELQGPHYDLDSRNSR